MSRHVSSRPAHRWLACLLLIPPLLAACARSADPASPGPGDAASAGDQPVSSDMVAPVGGDLRVGSPWYLLGGVVASDPGTSPVTLTFTADQVGGRAAVNAWSASYSATSSGGLTLGPIAVTSMAGPPQAMSAEKEFLDVLATVDGYTTVAAGELYLFSADSNVLTFSSVQPAGEPTVSARTRALAAEVVGMSEARARAAVQAADATFRVVSRDGTALPVTDDYRTNRVNVTLVGGTVTEATVG